MTKKQAQEKGWYFSRARGWRTSGRRGFVYEAWIEDATKTKSGKNYFYADSPKFISWIVTEETL